MERFFYYLCVMRFKIKNLGVSLILTHRWQKGLNFYQKEKWNDFRLGTRVRYWDNPTQISIGLYLIFFKVWVVFYKI